MTTSTTTPTVREIMGSLTPVQLWAFGLAIMTIISGIGGLAFWCGQLTAEVKHSAISAQLAKLQTEALIQTERAQKTTDQLKQYVEYTTNLNSQIAQRDSQIVLLNQRMGRTNTCGYLQDMISALEQRISILSNATGARMSVRAYGANEDGRQKSLEETELTQLQQRAIAYSQQLAVCGK